MAEDVVLETSRNEALNKQAAALVQAENAMAAGDTPTAQTWMSIAANWSQYASSAERAAASAPPV